MLYFEEPTTPTTGENVKGTGTGASDEQTGQSTGFNFGLLPAIITASGNFLSNVISAFYVGSSIKKGTYYSKYNQGVNNNYNSGSTSLFLIAGTVIIVVLLKNK